jgi:hypothetical protein
MTKSKPGYGSLLRGSINDELAIDDDQETPWTISPEKRLACPSPGLQPFSIACPMLTSITRLSSLQRSGRAILGAVNSLPAHSVNTGCPHWRVAQSARTGFRLKNGGQFEATAWSSSRDDLTRQQPHRV